VSFDWLFGHPDGADPTPEKPRRWWLTVDVSDTGVGIAPADQPRVFDEFEQVNVQGRAATRFTAARGSVCRSPGGWPT
jgi:signal transduction histidine kinase